MCRVCLRAFQSGKSVKEVRRLPTMTKAGYKPPSEKAPRPEKPGKPVKPSRKRRGVNKAALVSIVFFVVIALLSAGIAGLFIW